MSNTKKQLLMLTALLSGLSNIQPMVAQSGESTGAPRPQSQPQIRSSTQARSSHENELLIRLNPSADKEHVKEILDEVNGTVVKTISAMNGNFTVLVVRCQKSKFAETEKKLKQQREFADVRRNTSLTANGAPNDPYYSQQWGASFMKFAQARGETPRAVQRQVVVRVIDTGCNILGPSELNCTQRNFTDGNGTLEMPADYGVPSMNGRVYHGTMVASVVCSKTANTDGIAGIADPGKGEPTTNLSNSLTMCRVSDGYGIYLSSVYEALGWIAESTYAKQSRGVVVISLGTSSGPTLNADPNMQYLGGVIRQNGTLVILAAGNENRSDPSPNQNCIRVAAVDQLGNKTSFSNYGAFKFAAPGTQIAVHPGTSEVAYAAGTSFAAPEWAGAISYLMSMNSSLTADQAHKIIVQTARETENGRWKVPNLYKAVLEAKQ